MTLDRRTFVGVFGGGLVIARVAEAQPAAKVYRVGFLLGATAESVASLFSAFDEGLRDLGYIEGRNLVFERRYADRNMERLPELAAELVRLRVDVIVTGTNIHVAAVRGATTAIPIVMVFVADPVRSGFVASLARPGGNITGLSADASPDLWAKYLALLKEIVPKLSRVGVLGPGRLRRARRGLRKAQCARGRRSSDPG
jgi:putative ABC transport system substrate-binding protein